MSSVTLSKIRCLNGNLSVPGDKSISHRALILAAMANGASKLENLATGEDIQSTVNCLREIGVQIDFTSESRVSVRGMGSSFWQKPKKTLYAGNSGTTARLMLGLLASLPFESILDGDESLRKRPMGELAHELRKLGAKITLSEKGTLPAKIQGQELLGVDLNVSKPSAQLKSSLMIAALRSRGHTRISGKLSSRDHTERLFHAFGLDLSFTHENLKSPIPLSLEDQLNLYLDHPDRNYSLILRGQQTLSPFNLKIPGDPSSASFWISAACTVPGSKIEMDNVSLNPTRLGFVRLLQRMGASIKTEITSSHPEPVGRLWAEFSSLKAIDPEPQEVPFLIDELPLFAITALSAVGTTRVRGAKELRIKETDRINALKMNFSSLGLEMSEYPDGFKISGQQLPRGATVRSFGDHRIAMSFAIGALRSEKPLTILDADCVCISYPDFFKKLEELSSAL